MPRIPRGAIAGQVVHALNRGNRRATLFEQADDYQNFIRLMAEARDRFGLKVYAFCIMPNHFHLAAEGTTDNCLSEFMQWWLTSHVRRYHQLRGTSGHVWQGRFKSIPVRHDEHMLTLLRYVLLNPLRAGLTRTTTEWPWLSLHAPGIVDPWPVRVVEPVTDFLARGVPPEELKRIRNCIVRQAPYGDDEWARQFAHEEGMDPSLAPRGRPRLVTASPDALRKRMARAKAAALRTHPESGQK